MAILSKYKLEEYQYGIHVQRGRQLYMMSEKKIYFGEWLTGKRDQIIIIEMSKQLADREAQFYLEVNGHDSIIRTFGSIGNSLNLIIFVQEYAPQGDLADCLMDNQFQITQPMLIQMFVQIADAMSYVASKNIVHGDLGCRNVLVFRADSSEPKNNLVKITDFGLARWIDRPPASEDPTIIPVRYCATEILRNNRHSSYSEKTDVYSMGVLMWEALSNSEIPYSSVAEDDDVIQKKLDNEKLPQPHVCDRQLWVLMNNCWHKDPQQRPTFETIKDKLLDIKISELSHDLITASSYKTQTHYDYELDIDVKIKGLLNDGYPSIYEAQWITEEKRPIILIEKNEELSEYEKSFYTTFKNHRYIVHTFGLVGNDRGSIMILQEQAPHGNLQSLLETGHFKPSAKVLVEIFSQIIDAMIDIVGQKLVHGDLRCENVLVFKMHPSDPKRNLVKLSNFTLAHPNDPSHTDDRRLNIPVRYCALEILRSAGRSNYSEDSDIYSMGVLMWQAFSKGKHPYHSSKTNSEVRQRKLKGEILPKPLLCDGQIWLIMKDCWLNEPTIRYKFKEMKIRFSTINLESIEPYQYELNVNVQQKRPLNGLHGKFYEADWIPKRDPPIILFVMDEVAAEHEALLYMKLKSHPYIIQTFGLVKNDLQLVMLLQERALYGNLQTLLQNGEFQPSPKVLVTIFLQIVDAMVYIASQGIVHGDLRCANVLVFEMHSTEPTRNLVKLTNFSLARTKDQSVTNYRLPDTSMRYCALEILRSEDESNYSELSDVYSMGVLMWEACSKGEVPYGYRRSDHDVRQQRLNNEILSRPKDCPNPLWTVIEYCWLTELEVRFTFEQLKSQLLANDLTTIPCVPCYRCKNDIPEDEMNDHQKLCMPQMSDIDVIKADTGSTQPIHRNEEYVDIDTENDQESHPTKRLRVEFPESTIFLPPMGPYDEIDLDDTIEDHPVQFQSFISSIYIPFPIKQNPVVPSEECIRYISCKYCDKQYPDCSIEEHQISCDSKSNRSSVVKTEPKAFYIQCDHCNKQFSTNEIVDHQLTCPPRHRTSPTDSVSMHRIQCRHCNQQFSLDRIDAHEELCQPISRSLWNRICSSLCFRRSKN